MQEASGVATACGYAQEVDLSWKPCKNTTEGHAKEGKVILYPTEKKIEDQ